MKTSTTMLTLWYRAALIGYMENAFCCDETWYGHFVPNANMSSDELSKRVMAYVRFCEQWNERLRSDEASGPDPVEFEAFSDVVCTGYWEAKPTEAGTGISIQDAPVFFLGGDVSFRLIRVVQK